MKKLAKLLTMVLVSGVMTLNAYAADTTKQVEAYAHPTLFKAQAQELVDANSVYQIGGNFVKSENQLALKEKNSVLVDSWVKDVLSLIKNNKPGDEFDIKMPVLRSELAIILAEGFAFNSPSSKTTKYADVNSRYWAASWIYKTTNAGVMIGYPDKNFRPDQPITKAEVFATIAKMIDVQYDKRCACVKFNGEKIQYIPDWARNAAKEVVASAILQEVPDQSKVISDEYLSKEQVAYLVGVLRTNLATSGDLFKSCKKYAPVYINAKLQDRISAKHSNIGDKFIAKTLADVEVSGISFPVDSQVVGKVIEVKRPGIKNPGFIKVKFVEIKNGKEVAIFPKNVSDVQTAELKNPNVVARLFGAPFTTSARIVGVAGRTAGSGVNVAANTVEQFGDDLSNVFVETLSLKPVAGIRSFGSSFLTLGKGIFNLGKLAVSAPVGLLYEFGDEVAYLFVPSLSNESSLNPGEELVIIY